MTNQEPVLTEHADGTREWRLNDQLHRTDGPAYEWADGSRSWWINGQLHRIDGPAMEWADGSRQWLVDDQHLSFGQWLDAVATTPEERMALCLRWG